MRHLFSVLLAFVLVPSFASAAGVAGDWPRWRGPNDDGMARGDAPLHWSDTENIAWKTPIPGRGHSPPVVWGDRIFLITAAPTGGSGSGASLREHKFTVLCFDRKTGKLLWEKVARVSAPHEGHHPQYGSFASNSPVADGKHVVAFFGSRGVYCYTHEGQLVWQKDFGKLRMFREFGEGAWPALDGDKLVLVLDQQEGDSFLLALDKNTWRLKCSCSCWI